MLDLYERRWQGELMHPGDFVICADYNQIAKPFAWKFTRRDLADLIARVSDHEPRLRLAA